MRKPNSFPKKYPINPPTAGATVKANTINHKKLSPTNIFRELNTGPKTKNTTALHNQAPSAM
ncbi:MAG: hypothetical protein NWF01_09385 [Candidatus Bathyarchaeota archaeon]|nr:hypothetical protein [Candidatus Bathyarchaeota archaeon]